MLMALISLMIPVSGGLDARLGLLGAGLFVCVLNIATFNQCTFQGTLHVNHKLDG